MTEEEQNRDAEKGTASGCLNRPALQNAESVELRPVKTGLIERRSFFRSSIAFMATMCLIYGSGLPALALTLLWQSLNMSHLLASPAITSHSVYWLFYIAGLGVLGGPLLVLLFFNALLLTGHKASLRFRLNERGFGWVNNVFSRLTVLVHSGPAGKIPWESLVYISCGPLGKEFVAKHDIARRFPRYYFYCLPDYIYFAVIRENKKTKAPQAQYVTIPILAFEENQRQQILQSILQWAPDVPITDTAIKALGGSTRGEENPKYTQLWLQLLKSTSAEKQTKLRFEPGESIGRYTIEELIETGGQANIYRASVNHDGSQSPDLLPHDLVEVVLKQFVLSSANTSARHMSIRDFENEFLLLSKLEGSNIIKLYDVFVEQQHAFLVLEHIKGGSLRKLVENGGPVPEERVVQIAAEICRALEILHLQEPAIVHRDVSPENILLNENIAKLIDFSLAVPIAEDTEQVVGKQIYISPEQFRGQIHPRNDIYALGATMYFALTGDEPEAVSQHSPKVKNQSISSTIDGIVRRCTDLDSQRRYADASELLKDLESLRIMTASSV